MKYVIDSYAWIAYFMGTEDGEKAKPIIESLEEKITPKYVWPKSTQEPSKSKAKNSQKSKEPSSKKKAP